MPKQYLDMLMSWFSRRYHGWFSVYPTFLAYFKLFHRCYTIPLYPNLHLMIANVKILMKTLVPDKIRTWNLNWTYQLVISHPNHASVLWILQWNTAFVHWEIPVTYGKSPSMVCRPVTCSSFPGFSFSPELSGFFSD